MAMYWSVLYLCCCFGLTWTVNVPMEDGVVVGQTIPLSSGKRVHSFYGIPFAKPPVGDLRFSPPERADRLNGTFVADTLSTACIQDPVGFLWLTHPGWIRYSEDCLTLSIFTPENLQGGPYAVMVWFYGGGFVTGANIQYPGHFLAAKDVIVVVPNYRVGAFGFLSTEDGYIKGNMGLLDQVIALEFVRDNIAAFGGNPNRVTIFGQSAGGASSGLHLLSPRSQGLFHSAICESGTEANLWSLNYPNQRPYEYVYQVADTLNCTKENTVDMIACLRSVSSRDLRLAQAINCTPGYFCQGFAPVVDGPGGFIPDMPLTLREQGNWAQVPLMTGITKDDGALYTLFYIPEANEGDGFNHTEFEYYIKDRLLGFFEEQMTPKEFEDTWQYMNYYYSPWPYIEDKEGNRQAINRILTDAAYGMPWDRQAKMQSAVADTYLYVMAFRSLNASSFIPEWMGVPHMGEIPYVWGYGRMIAEPDVRNDSRMSRDPVGWTPEDITYAEYVETLFSNFAKFHNPTPAPVKSPFNDTMTTWPKFTFEEMNVIYLAAEISNIKTYRQREYGGAGFLAYLSNIPFSATFSETQTSGQTKSYSRVPIYEQLMSKFVRQQINQNFPGVFDDLIAAIDEGYLPL